MFDAITIIQVLIFSFLVFTGLFLGWFDFVGVFAKKFFKKLFRWSILTLKVGFFVMVGYLFVLLFS